MARKSERCTALSQVLSSSSAYRYVEIRLLL
jgi:hypothetical protein